MLTINALIILVGCIILVLCLMAEYYLVPLDKDNLSGNLYHYTTEKSISGILQKDSNIYLKESKKIYSPTGVYFFKEKPGLINRILLGFQNAKFVVVINISDIKDKDKLYLRPSDKSIVYKSEFHGIGYIEKN